MKEHPNENVLHKLLSYDMHSDEPAAALRNQGSRIRDVLTNNIHKIRTEKFNASEMWKTF